MAQAPITVSERDRLLSPERKGVVVVSTNVLSDSSSIQGEDNNIVAHYSSQSPQRDPESNACATKKKLKIWQKLSYGVGHVFNDMCASMWFTYFLVFYHMVVRLNNTYAGLLLLIGQVTDGLATPVIGYLCDKTRCRYGRRKVWHLAGTIMVACSLFFFWHHCLPCKDRLCHNSTPGAGEIVYFVVPIMVFQMGWASVQISHLSLIPELTDCESERVGLNAIRYAFTILSNVIVFVSMFLLLEFASPSSSYSPPGNCSATELTTTLLGNGTSSSRISPADEWIFSGEALGIVGVGLFFSFLFHLGTREPSTPAEQKAESALGRKIAWYKWFINPQFYTVAVIYMCTRLIVNLTQVYIPLFLIDSLMLSKQSLAIGPLLVYMSGFAVTLLLRLINKIIGRYMAYFIGIAFVWGGLIWFWVSGAPTTTAATVIVYGAAILIGAGNSTLLVTSLSMVADLIGCNVGSSAFVYGLMSFTDKLSNGIAVQIIQALHPCKGSGASVCCSACSKFYREVLVYVPGGASLLTCVALGVLSIFIYRRSRRCKDVMPLSEACKKPAPSEPSCCSSLEQSMVDHASDEEKKSLVRNRHQ